MKNVDWKPLLSGPLAARAREGARAIAADLGRLRGPEELAPSYGRDVASSLASGAAGLAVAFSFLAEARLARGGAARAGSFLASAGDAMAEVDMEPDLFGGFTGVAWAAALLWPADSGGGEDPLAGVDPDVLSLLDPPGWDGPFDLVSGLVGFGLYAMERLPRPSAVALLERVVDELERRAERRDGGLAWRTDPVHLSPLQREQCPEGHDNLGVAHGVPGVVGLLAQAFAAGVAAPRARRLLDGGVAWLLAQRGASPPRFAYWLTPGGERQGARSAWCYGDPGVAAVLLVAARCVGEPAWERAALDLAREAAARPHGETGVVDANLCHGAAGLAHLYNRAWQRTGDGDLKRAAVEWVERTLAMRRPGEGHGGYLTALKAVGGSLTYEPDPSLLSGAAGTALALAAAASRVEPRWDRMLLLSSRFER